MIFCDNPDCVNHVYVPGNNPHQTLRRAVYNNSIGPHLSYDVIETERHEFRTNYTVYERGLPVHTGQSTWLCDVCASPVKFLQDRTEKFNRAIRR